MKEHTTAFLEKPTNEILYASQKKPLSLITHEAEKNTQYQETLVFFQEYHPLEKQLFPLLKENINNLFQIKEKFSESLEQKHLFLLLLLSASCNIFYLDQEAEIDSEEEKNIAQLKTFFEKFQKKTEEDFFLELQKFSFEKIQSFFLKYKQSCKKLFLTFPFFEETEFFLEEKYKNLLIHKAKKASHYIFLLSNTKNSIEKEKMVTHILENISSFIDCSEMMKYCKEENISSAYNELLLKAYSLSKTPKHFLQLFYEYKTLQNSPFFSETEKFIKKKLQEKQSLLSFPDTLLQKYQFLTKKYFFSFQEVSELFFLIDSVKENLTEKQEETYKKDLLDILSQCSGTKEESAYIIQYFQQETNEEIKKSLANILSTQEISLENIDIIAKKYQEDPEILEKYIVKYKTEFQTLITTTLLESEKKIGEAFFAYLENEEEKKHLYQKIKKHQEENTDTPINKEYTETLLRLKEISTLKKPSILETLFNETKKTFVFILKNIENILLHFMEQFSLPKNLNEVSESAEYFSIKLRKNNDSIKDPRPLYNFIFTLSEEIEEDIVKNTEKNKKEILFLLRRKRKILEKYELFEKHQGTYEEKKELGQEIITLISKENSERNIYSLLQENTAEMFAEIMRKIDSLFVRFLKAFKKREYIKEAFSSPEEIKNKFSESIYQLISPFLKTNIQDIDQHMEHYMYLIKSASNCIPKNKKRVSVYKEYPILTEKQLHEVILFLSSSHS
jgi:hypothetical protein